jgi:hypothetical protein
MTQEHALTTRHDDRMTGVLVVLAVIIGSGGPV